MRVLLTNNTLHFRAGSELYIRDVAIELMRRGHKPVAYSTHLGPVAEELRAATVPVIDRLEFLGDPPDIIHGQHHYDTLIALLRFPNVPAVYFCHGWTPWQEAALKQHNILRYAAVSELCRERLVAEGGVNPGRVEIVSNFFDQRLFPTRPPLPASPKVALAFGNEFDERTAVPILREACDRNRIELDVCGLANGNPITEPGPLLARYDVVFAKGRAAIEALAVGASVILCDHSKLGPLVSSRNIHTLRRFNFGLRTFSDPLVVEGVLSRLANYDRADAAATSQIVRRDCELQAAVDRIVGIYEQVLKDAALQPPSDAREIEVSAAKYLESWAPRYKDHSGMRDLEVLLARVEAAEQLAELRKAQISEVSDTAHQHTQALEILTHAKLLEKTRALDQVAREREAERKFSERNILDLQNRLRRRDEEIAALAAEIEALRQSASWRWAQGILRSTPVQFLFGGAIRQIAQRQRASSEERADFSKAPKSTSLADS